MFLSFYHQVGWNTTEQPVRDRQAFRALGTMAETVGRARSSLQPAPTPTQPGPIPLLFPGTLCRRYLYGKKPDGCRRPRYTYVGSLPPTLQTNSGRASFYRLHFGSTKTWAISAALSTCCVSMVRVGGKELVEACGGRRVKACTMAVESDNMSSPLVRLPVGPTLSPLSRRYAALRH